MRYHLFDSSKPRIRHVGVVGGYEGIDKATDEARRLSRESPTGALHVSVMAMVRSVTSVRSVDSEAPKNLADHDALRDALAVLSGSPGNDELCDRIVGLLERRRKPWVWMPHAGHFILRHRCQFHMNTCVGEHLVSTVGELVMDSHAREALAISRGVVLEGVGDARERDYMRKIGFEDIGLGTKYETMVFPSKPNTDPKYGCAHTSQRTGEK